AHIVGKPLYHCRRQRAQQIEPGFLLSQPRSEARIKTHEDGGIHSTPIIAMGNNIIAVTIAFINACAYLLGHVCTAYPVGSSRAKVRMPVIDWHRSTGAGC